MSYIYFPLQKKETKIKGEKTIADYAKELNIQIDMPCGGEGICGKCRVKIDGKVSGLNEIEKQHDLGIYRLACQTIPLGETYVIFSEATAKRKGFIPRKIKSDGKKGYSVALDLGTTTLAAYLIDNETGELLRENAKLNPQRQYGEDVITRISLANERIYEVLMDGINDLLKEILNEERKPDTICVVGNPTMHHFFLGYDVKSLGKAPYEPVSKKPEFRSAKELGLGYGITVYTPPIIAGFIGSDILAGAIASELFISKEPAMLIDIGTNGEIIISDGEQLVAASCAMGPAFEGSKIKYGSIAKPGAIEKVRMVDNKVFYSTIENSEARSICGSGIVDIVAELYRNGKIKESGAFMDKKKEFKISDNVSFSRKDISEVQLAKAAMQSAQEILLGVLGLSPKDLKKIYIAGSFGSFIDKESARRINLIPNIALDKVESIGNAAGEGAREMLISKKMREVAEELAERITYIELLEKQYKFNDRFIKNMYFS
jgi:uncharacterized 2Fe-2S/4Fe-4S cluster protein (DUF4445 family)